MFFKIEIVTDNARRSPPPPPCRIFAATAALSIVGPLLAASHPPRSPRVTVTTPSALSFGCSFVHARAQVGHGKDARRLGVLQKVRGTGFVRVSVLRGDGFIQGTSGAMLEDIVVDNFAIRFNVH